MSDYIKGSELDRRVAYLEKRNTQFYPDGRPKITWPEYKELLKLRGESTYFTDSSDSDDMYDDDFAMQTMGYVGSEEYLKNRGRTTTTTSSRSVAAPQTREEIMEDIKWRNIADELDEKDVYMQGFEKAYRVKMNSLLNLRKQVGGRQWNVSMPQVTLEDYIADSKVLDCYLYIERWKLRKKLGMAPPSDWGVPQKYNQN